MPVSIRRPCGFVIVIFLLLIDVAHGAKSDWAEGAPGRSSGASRDYYNSAAKLSWNNFMGDWRDANDKPQGDRPYAATRVDDTDMERFVEWDVAELVEQWRNGKHPNQGFFLRTVGAGGAIVFCSRENTEKSRRPRLVVKGDKGSLELHPTADTHLVKSTYRSQGHTEQLRVAAGSDNTLIRFNLAKLNDIGSIQSAKLQLYTTRQYGDADIGVFRCRQGHDVADESPTMGLAEEYSRDARIATHPNVIFAANFESDDWNERWTYAGIMEVIDTVAEDERRRFASLDGKALRVRIARGSTGALNTLFKFRKHGHEEPNEIYFRYYLRLGETWNQRLQGGKMPGVSGTYGTAGWGGRKSNGKNGWSARGLFGLSIPEGNPLSGLHPIGTYCYHADMKGTYGDNWYWDRGYRGFLEKNRWYCVEQFLKLNTPGEKDGVLRAWIDGRLAFEKKDIRFRLTEKLKIEQIWMNVYHGGTKPSPYDQHVFIDNVVIARQYIGPMKR